MLIEDGYAHSLKALLEKSRAEEMELAARRAHVDPSDVAYTVRMIDRIARLWTRSQPLPPHWSATRRPSSFHR
jgi:hypothetical protein